MSNLRTAVVDRARALIGVPFRPQGRDVAIGLDCVGLVMQVFEIPALAVKRNYRLAEAELAMAERELRRFFLSASQREPGDVILCAVGRHPHLAIDCGASFIHADARLRRVVETPGAPEWPVLAAYRRTAADFQAS